MRHTKMKKTRAKKTRYFMADGTPVTKFCRDNKLTRETVMRRIRINKLTPEEAVKPHLEHDGRKGGNKAKYFIDNVPLKKLCEYDERPHYSYGDTIRRITKMGCSIEQAYFRKDYYEAHYSKEEHYGKRKG